MLSEAVDSYHVTSYYRWGDKNKTEFHTWTAS